MSQRYSNLVLDSLWSKIIRVDDDSTKTNNPLPGYIRYNSTTKKFEGYTGESGPLGEDWRDFTLDMASSSVLGGVKVGDNLTINFGDIMTWRPSPSAEY